MAPDDAWFALVAATPQPEAGEAVNVGIIYGNGVPSRLEFLEGLPRLSGLVRPDEVGLIQEVMRTAAQRLVSGVSLEALRTSLSPQLRVSRPRGLFRLPDDKTAQVLRERYLAATPRVERGVAEDVALRKQSEHDLDRVVSRVSRLGMDVVRNARFEKLYKERPAWSEQVRVPRLARALRGDRRDILIDSVLVQPMKVNQAIAVATSRIGRAFWYYKRLKGDIRAASGRDVITVGVLLDGHTDGEREVVEARDYIKHTWTPDADLVLEVDRQADLNQLRERVRWLVEGK